MNVEEGGATGAPDHPADAAAAGRARLAFLRHVADDPALRPSVRMSARRELAEWRRFARETVAARIGR